MSKIYAFDLDDTLCVRPSGLENLGAEKYKFCVPIPKMVEKLNILYDEGNTIYIYTAIGMSYFEGDVKIIYEKLYDLTLESLSKWGVKHHGLFMGKLHYDFLIDDKTISPKDFLEKY